MNFDPSVIQLFKEVQPDFLSPKIESPVRLHRYDSLGERYYFEFFEGGGRLSYISVTSLARLAIPMGAGYYKWLQAKGEGANVEKTEKMIFGSLFHVEAMKPIHGKDPVHGKGYNFDWLDQIVPGEFYRGQDGGIYPATNFHCMVPLEWRWKANDWRYAFKKGLLSWFYFIKTRVVEVFAVEYAVRCMKRRIAATIDMVHTSPFYGKDRLCITDIKSFLFSPGGDESKSFYDSHEFQLAVCKTLFNELHAEQLGMEVTHVFNWAPKDFRKPPKDWSDKYVPYNWVNQTSSRYNQMVNVNGQQKLAADVVIDSAHAMKWVEPATKIADIRGAFENMDMFNAEDHAIEFDFFDH